MYLTRIDMRLSNPAVSAALRDAQKMHQITAGLFKSSRQDADILYRVRVKGYVVSLYLYSDVPVDPSGLLSGTRICVAGIARSRDGGNPFSGGGAGALSGTPRDGLRKL